MTLVKFKNDGGRRDIQRVPFFSPMFTDVFDTLFGKEMFNNELESFIPVVNISENKEAYNIEASLPGMKKEEVAISVENKMLTISGERKREENEETETFTRREFSYGTFKRSFSLPDSVEADNIQAVFNNGILKIILPKREEAKQKPVKQIQIS